jgi:epoxyqueuosine reductase
VVAVPLNKNRIEPYLRKQDHAAHDRDNAGTTNLASGIALQLAKLLELKGHPSVAVAANHVYRPDSPHGIFDEHPDISHRYLAVRAGVGWFGYSGNVIRPDTAAALVLATVVTQAKLKATPPLPPDDNYCDECRFCLGACFSGFMDEREMTTISLGGKKFSYSRRRNHARCDYVCGGFAGLHPSGEWSTWSPSRYPIPESGEGFQKAIRKAAKAYYLRPDAPGGFYNPLLKGKKLEFTCGHCMLICHPDLEVRKRRFAWLKSSGVIIQEPDGPRRAVSGKEGQRHVAAMDPARRSLYEVGKG